MTVFHTSDTHFGHKNIITYCDRPFASVEEMDEGMVDRWNAVVRPEDSVYHYGDVAMGKISTSILHVARLNGNKFLIPGNHDTCWPGNKKVRTSDKHMYEDVGFTILNPTEHRVIGETETSHGRVVRMCHFPYEGDSHDGDRFTEWRPKNDGLWIIHGHVHEKWKVKNKQLNVGVDVWDFTPVSEAQIVETIAQSGLK